MLQREKERPIRPELHESVFVAEGVRIYGDVSMDQGASIWFNAVLRADEGSIHIGKDTNIQDNVVIHSDRGSPVLIGDGVTVGHGAVIRSCRIGSGTMIGMNATVMSNSEIGEDSVVGANALVPYNVKFPPRSLIVGVPARVSRQLTDDEVKFNRSARDNYLELVSLYSSGLILSHDAE